MAIFCRGRGFPGRQTGQLGPAAWDLQRVPCGFCWACGYWGVVGASHLENLRVLNVIVWDSLPGCVEKDSEAAHQLC